ncbi:glycogen debranching protein [Bifidobacterium cuniculi]|uniref:Glycogen debranching protein n=3 Tax=Bifidobacterium cuniculi TaxID=1688 RepID=A0A087B566_9BIFI|nr:TIM-barrel domain-containing protein [Bifidobacterium cuniculi]KFI66166.1 glycogen debranching protein [Bifidobacterium cuniculi]
MATHPSFSQFTANLHPQVPADRTVSGEHWRISPITDSLVRLEWSDDGIFEDRPTQVVLNRDLGGDVHADIRRTGGGVRIETPALLLDYDGRPFSKEGLSIVVKGVPGSQFNTWHYGERGGGNLLGTARTLDEVDGDTPLGDGILSRDGWAVLDDSASNVLDDAATVGGEDNPFGTWPVPRVDDPGRVDLYVFAYGLRFLEAIRDWHRLTGPTPLLPRWALGNWWSRFYRYDQDGYLNLMDRFRAEGLPFTVAVIDMDWHLTDADPKYGSGWTGYTWNRDLFPDPTRLLADLHDRGMRVTLNEHPRDGIRAFEEEYPAVARAMGVDPESGEPVAFDPSSPRFLDAYLDMHHRMAADGVDFWWIDWQQGGVTRQRGLDPLWMLNHVHWLDSLDEAGKEGSGRWPMTFSRFAGPGSHRYPIGFSGDTIVSWRSLEFQPRFTATAANIGYDWWSHDIGGHMLGRRDDELEARWYQFGVFSPINRLHSSSSPFSGKEPWNFPEPVRHAMAGALRLRQRLLPYLHTMNYRTAFRARPLVEPMYWQDPGIGEAYDYPNEYRFGSELVVAPVVRPRDPVSRLARTDLWLPQGEWFDFFDGRRYRAPRPGGRRLAAWRGIERIPAFAKAGGIVPLQTLDGPDALNSTDNPRLLRVLAFPGDGSFTLHEDDGEWTHVRQGRAALTDLRQEWGDDAVVFTVGAVRGDAAAVPEVRDWAVAFRGVGDAPGAVTATVDGAPVDCVAEYDEATLTLSVTVRAVPRSAVLRVEASGLRAADDPATEDCRRVLMDAQMPNLTKDVTFSMIAEQGAAALAGLRALDMQAGAPHADLAESHMPESVIAALEEILLRSRS